MIISALRDSGVGFVGVIGGHLYCNCEMGWIDAGLISGGLAVRRNNKISLEADYTRFYNRNFVEVVSIDGLFLACRRDLLDKVHFDEQSFQGYHCYDIDICLQTIACGYKNILLKDILIEHKSSGNHNKEWFIATHTLYQKWKNYLPIYKGVQLSENELLLREELAASNMEKWKVLYDKDVQLKSVLNSTYYKFGKLILAPLKFALKVIKK